MGDSKPPGHIQKPAGQGTSGSIPKKIGKYLIKSMLGRGGMGIVYLGQDPTLDRSVAVKTLSQMSGSTSQLEADQMVQRFIREARTIAKLDHKNVVAVYDVGKHGDRYFIAMEYVDGRTLSWIIGAHKALNFEEKLKIMVQICRGLQAAHDQGLVHRDIKPSNIMINKKGVVKIMDFGLVRTEESELTRTHQLMGTPNYMSPEQLSGTPVDQRSDIFSLGAVFYELVTGEKAFSGNSVSAVIYKIIHEIPSLPSKINPVVSHGKIDEVIMKAISKNPEERYASCGEILKDLKSIMAGSPVQTKPSKASPQPGITSSRIIIFHSTSVVAVLQNPFDQPIEIEIDGQFSASLKRKQYVETRLELGEHRMALRHGEKLVKSIKYASEHTFSVTAETTCIEVTSKLAATHFRLLERLPNFFKKEYVKVEPDA